MNLYQQLRAITERFLEVSTSDPDDARRGRITNIILGVLGLISVSGVITTVLLTIIGVLSLNDAPAIFLSSLATGFGAVIIYLINRYRSGVIASTLLILLTMAAMSFADTPENLIGRSLFLFIFPPIFASVLLGSRATFPFFILASIQLVIISVVAGLPPYEPIFAILTFLLVAFISWLSSRGLEQALTDLRGINANLDQLVVERTQALAEALTRERIEAGRGQAILNSIADGVIVFDLNGRAIQVNPSLTQLIETPAVDILGSTMAQISSSQALNAANQKTLSGLLSEPGEQLTSQRIEWGRKTLSVSSAQVLDSENSLIGTVAVFRDYTQEAEVERMKNTFLGIVSHELRTPLNAILGYAEMFKEGVYGIVNSSQIKSSARIMANTQRLLGIVNDLLDHTRMEAGKVTIQMRSFRLRELVENVDALLDKPAREKGLKLISELDNTLPETIIGDPARLQQVMVNLVNNAIKYTDKGSVRVQAYEIDKRHWGISVTDTGHGIPQEKIPAMFEAFRQGDSGSTREAGGFGLGLAIVKQLVELMDGEISVESQVDVGSTFTVIMPLITDS
ncbi:MAG: PAS domain-containing protein [Anaerolineales bacterium]|nr:PAS domain-containing protein [Anaerolineales bacterium]